MADVGMVDERGSGRTFCKVLHTFLAFSKSLWPMSCVQAVFPDLALERGLFLHNIYSDPQGRGHGFYQRGQGGSRISLL